MEDRMMQAEVELRKYGQGVVHLNATSLKVFKDARGEPWLCPADVDPDGDFEAQGCWRCRDLAFTASD